MCELTVNDLPKNERITELPLAYAIPIDELAQSRVRGIINSVGHLATASEVIFEPEKREANSTGYASLMEAIWFADQGEVDGRLMVEANVRTHIIECLMKSGVILEAKIGVDSQGRLIQYGQLLEKTYENALRWASDGSEMRERTLLEIYNGFLGANWHNRGLLDKQRIVVFSPYPTSPELTDEQARKIGFFPDTKSCAIQSLTMRDGELVQEVAFVSGVTEQGGIRHDLAAITSLAAELGIPDMGSTRPILGTPIAISNNMSLLDIVKGYDRHAGAYLEKSLFFGQCTPPQDYDAYIDQRRRRIEELEPFVQATVQDLLTHALTIKHPLDAIRLLHDCAQRNMVDLALIDNTIDERVFGPEAVPYIERARFARDAGDLVGFLSYRELAQGVAQTGSCPVSEAVKGMGIGPMTGTDTGASGSCPEIKNGQLVTCPDCKKKVRAIVPDKDTIYCSNPNCTLAPSYLKEMTHTKQDKKTVPMQRRAKLSLWGLLQAA